MKSNSLILYPFPSFLKTTFRMSRIRVISFIVRVLKKAVNKGLIIIGTTIVVIPRLDRGIQEASDTGCPITTCEHDG